jgi:hypothetical protein
VPGRAGATDGGRSAGCSPPPPKDIRVSYPWGRGSRLRPPAPWRPVPAWWRPAARSSRQGRAAEAAPRHRRLHRRSGVRVDPAGVVEGQRLAARQLERSRQQHGHLFARDRVVRAEARGAQTPDQARLSRRGHVRREPVARADVAEDAATGAGPRAQHDVQHLDELRAPQRSTRLEAPIGMAAPRPAREQRVDVGARPAALGDVPEGGGVGQDDQRLGSGHVDLRRPPQARQDAGWSLPWQDVVRDAPRAFLPHPGRLVSQTLSNLVAPQR